MAKKKLQTATPAEQVQVTAGLKKQYPQMFTPSWAAALKGKVQKEFKTQRTSQIEDELRRSGMSEDMIRKLRGNK